MYNDKLIEEIATVPISANPVMEFIGIVKDAIPINPALKILDFLLTKLYY